MRTAWLCGLTTFVIVASVRKHQRQNRDSIEHTDELDNSLANGDQGMDAAAVASSRRRRARRRSDRRRSGGSPPPRRRSSDPPRRRSPAGPKPGQCSGSGTQFMVIGDFGRRNSHQTDIAKGYAAVASSFKPSFHVSTGDNIYGSKGTTAHFKQTWYDYYIKYGSLQKKWHACQGNHDWKHEASYAAGGFTKSSLNKGNYWDSPAFWFKKSYGEVDFFFTDTMVEKREGVAGQKQGDAGRNKQRAWLESEMKNSNKAWKIVIVHHPLARWDGSKVSKSGSRLLTIAEKYKVSVVFAGHHHHVELVKASGVNHIISGAGAYGSQSSEKTDPGKGLLGYYGGGGFITFKVCDSRKADVFVYGGTGKFKRKFTISANTGSRALDNAEDFGIDDEESVCGGVKLNDVDRPCSRSDLCTVAVDRDQTEPCEVYCAEHGLACVGGWLQDQEVPDGCSLSEALGCDKAKDSLDNHVCQCAPVA